MHMYKIANGQLLNIIEVVTPNQIALVTTTVCSVKGYDNQEPIDIYSVPEKIEQTGKTSELHYIDGHLEWVYTDLPLTDSERITQLQSQVEELTTTLGDLILEGGI